MPIRSSPSIVAARASPNAWASLGGTQFSVIAMPSVSACNASSRCSGDEAVTAAKAKAYDLILLDLMLPERRGTDVLETLRNTENDLIPQSRVLVLTNFDQDEESRLAMQAKADGYLIKADITPRKLLEIIGSLSRKI
ncbi:response regulator receiver protein [candidate division TM7 genomosp. GTL1]|nr:response regulator receiver protein [candidate division TM7 genomosp. GTL1]